jgi:hypothetical protein
MSYRIKLNHKDGRAAMNWEGGCGYPEYDWFPRAFAYQCISFYGRMAADFAMSPYKSKFKFHFTQRKIKE